MLFLDLEGFTRLSERHGHRLLPQLGEWFDEMSGQIAARGGTIDKYLGDGIMALWGAPDHNDDHAVELRVQWYRRTAHTRIETATDS